LSRHTSHDQYDNALVDRYASREMAEIWSPRRKFRTWRQIWVALAEAEADLGLPITQAQIAELRAHVDDIDFDTAARYERELRHDVMAHVHAFGDVCPSARGIIHLGATSCDITDNADLLLIGESLRLVRSRLVAVLESLGDFARRYRDLPCLGLTHLQPAQPTTVGKRACLWAYELVMDLEEINHRLQRLMARGIKGATGTQASFLELFGGDESKVLSLEDLVVRKLGFHGSCPITGQTYSRKIDSEVLGTLSHVAQSAHKAATDLRIWQSRKEIEEPFEASQIGSSAMAYKRNPMRCERMCALARFVMSLESSGAQTAATQWMERTLDDSANRRLTLPQAFLAVDAILLLYRNVTAGLVVYSNVIARNLAEELPFLASEAIMLAAAVKGGDRQLLHERIRRHSHAAAEQVKQTGGPNDLLDRLKADEAFAGVDLAGALDASRYVGRAPQQVDYFLVRLLEPILERYNTRAMAPAPRV